MTITLELEPTVEIALRDQAQAAGLSLVDYVSQVMEREAQRMSVRPSARSGQALVDACATVRGVLTDEEIDELFPRDRTPARSVNLE